MPDTNTLPKLCEIFGVSINELLNGERISDENYVDKAEEKLLELQGTKQESDRILLTMELVIGYTGSIVFLGLIFLASFVESPTWLRIVLIAFGVVEFFIAAFFALRIEQKAGYYECSKCKKQYIPTYSQVLWAPHVNRTRYMKCKYCDKKSWHKKVIK